MLTLNRAIPTSRHSISRAWMKAAATSSAMFRVHTAKDLLGIVAGILDGEIRRTAGDLNGAIAAFSVRRAFEGARLRRAGAAPFSAFHWLGAALVA